MHANAFPDPRTYRFPDWIAIGSYVFRSHDVIAFGTPLTAKNAMEAYSKGIFPWFTEGIPLPWHCPERRAILDFDDLQVSRSLRKARKSSTLTFTLNKAFPEVVRECAESYRPGQYGTWITPEFERVFTQLHELGMAHSVEAWDEEGQLVGGLYGVDAGGVFCGESMFYHVSNASKLCLLFLIDHLRSRGSTWLDSQVMTPHFKALGAIEISRHKFLDKLSETQKQKLQLF